MSGLREIELTGKIVLRPMVPADGPALSSLYQASPDTGRIQIAPRYHLDAYAAFAAVRPRATGVVAEMDGFDGLVGAGFVDFGRCSFEDELRDYASLSGVVVHPDFRRKGIASRLAQWRVEYAREHVGYGGVILTSIQKENIGSFAVAKKWSRQFVGEITSGAVSMRKKMPAKIPGITVRRAEWHDLEAVAAGLNTFYHNYNLYEPQSAESLREWLEQSPYTAVIILSQFLHKTIAQSAIDHGVLGYFLMSDKLLLNLPVAIKQVNKGSVYFSLEFSQELFNAKEPLPKDLLTVQQRETILTIAKNPDKFYSQIADGLGIVERAVKGHLSELPKAKAVGLPGPSVH